VDSTRGFVLSGLSCCRYVGGFDIDKELEVRGSNGNDGVVEIAGCHSSEWIIRCSGKGVKLVNLRVVGFWKRRPCLVITAGDPQVQGCEIVGGVRIEGHARGDLQSNSVTGGNMPAIIIVDEASPQIRGNQVSGGAEAGIYVGGGSMPLIEQNRIFGNAEAGIVVSGASVPVICSNRIHDNNGNGVRIEGTACPTIEGNEVHDNVESNICAADQSAPVIEGNRIYDSGAYGVSCVGDSAPIVKHNEIYGNLKPGFRIGPAATAFIHGGNNMYGNGEDNVW